MATNTPDQLPGCTYHLLDTGIHQITFTSVSPNAMDELFVHLNAIFDGKTHDDPRLLILIDGSAVGFPSLNRVMVGGKNLVDRHPDRPPVRYALVFDGSVRHIVSALEKVIRLFRGTNEVRSFRPQEREEAEAWLLRNVVRTT